MPPPPIRPDAINPRREALLTGPPVSPKPGKYPAPADGSRRTEVGSRWSDEARPVIPEFTQGKQAQHTPPPPFNPDPFEIIYETALVG